MMRRNDYDGEVPDSAVVHEVLDWIARWRYRDDRATRATMTEVDVRAWWS